MASCSASLPGAPPSTGIPMCRETKPIAWYPCTPSNSSTFKTFGEKISASTGRGNEIAGFTEEDDDDEQYDDLKNRAIAYEQILAKLGLSIGRDQSRSSSW